MREAMGISAIPVQARRRVNCGVSLRLGITIAAGVVTLVLLGLRLAGLIRPFSVPTGAMSPAIVPGDHLIMERFSHARGTPRRGDVIVFKTDHMPQIPEPTIYLMRLVGLPGDALRLAGGKLFVNGQHRSLSNSAGRFNTCIRMALHYLPRTVKL